MIKVWLSVFGFIFLIVSSDSLSAPVPDTGQTKFYNNTVEISQPSPEQPFYGQDANYAINPMSYTKLDAAGKTLPDSAISWVMVKDNVTGLIWEVKKNLDGVVDYSNPHDADNTYTWYDPAASYPGTAGNGSDTDDFIEALNSANFGSFNDWRMPTVKELAYIIKYNIPAPGPTIDAYYFQNTQASIYWSKSAHVNNIYAWGINFDYGDDYYDDKSQSYYAIGVRGGQTEFAGYSVVMNILTDEAIGNDHYVDNNDGTVTDTTTGLMWQQNSPTDKKKWEQALSYCESLSLAGYTDWRLPSQKELRSIVDYAKSDPAINVTYFPNTLTDNIYWSSTTDASATNQAWGIKFKYGSDVNGSKYFTGFISGYGSYYVRAVRAGQPGSVDNWVLSVSPGSQNVSHITGSTTFSVTNTGTGTMPWSAQVTSGTSWLKITSGTNGSNAGTISCSFDSNTGTSARIGTIQVAATGAVGSPKNVTITQAGASGQVASKLLAVWSDGVYIWNLSTKQWAKVPSTSNVLMIATGKVDNDSIEDLVGVWPSGLFVRQSTNGKWVNLSTKTPTWITAGDLNNDGRDDIIGSWKADGVYSRDSATGNWTKITSPARQLTIGNIGGNGRVDLAGVWDTGLFVRYSATAAWQKIDSAIPVWTTTGDMTGDKRSDIIGSYSTGIWYRNSASAVWSKMASSAEQLATGDLNGDGRDDLIGVWKDGIWVLYAVTNQWQKITSSKPIWITTGRITDTIQAVRTIAIDDEPEENK